MQTETTYKNGERKLLEITAGEPSNSRFSVCFWLDGEWIMDDRPGLGLLKTSGYSIVAIHNLPNRTYPPNAEFRNATSTAVGIGDIKSNENENQKTEANNGQRQPALSTSALLGDWSQVPKGLCLIRMFHERTAKHCLHLQMKLNEGPWYDQPHVPMAYSQEATKDSHREFWDWAEKTLPIFDYKEIVKSQ